MSENTGAYAGLLQALQARDDNDQQTLIQKVHKAGGGKEGVQKNLKKMNKDIKEAKSQRPKTKRKKVYNSPYGYKKGGVTIKKRKKASYKDGGTIYPDRQAAEKWGSSWAHNSGADSDTWPKKTFRYYDENGEVQEVTFTHNSEVKRVFEKSEKEQKQRDYEQSEQGQEEQRKREESHSEYLRRVYERD